MSSDYVPQLNDLRSSLLTALNEAPPGASGGGYSDRGTRLLLMLPHLKHCGLQFLGVLSEVQRDSRVPSYGLLRDVVDSWRELDSVSILQRRTKRDDEEPIVPIK